MEAITQQELEKIPGIFEGIKTFRGVFARAAVTPRGLLKVLAYHLLWSRAFGPAVAQLAGRIAEREDLFRQRRTDGPPQSRSTEVASGIFAAAIDEFGGGSLDAVTHRALADALWESAASTLGIRSRALTKLANDRLIQETAQKIRAAHGVMSTRELLTDKKLMQCIGFHLGSEMLAREEFRVIDTYLRERYAELVTRLETDTVNVGGTAQHPYAWITIHHAAENEHFIHALRSANLALEHYAGSLGIGVARAYILEGVRENADLLERFAKAIPR